MNADEQIRQDRELLAAASKDSDDWDSATWAAWWRTAERHAPHFRRKVTQAAAVAAEGALPVPVGDQPQPLDGQRLAEIREHVASARNWSLGNLAARDLLAEVDRLKAELVEQNLYAIALEADLCTCEPLCESGEYLHAADCPVAEVQMRMDGCPSFEGNPAAPDLCAGCGDSRRWHKEAAS